METSFTPTPLSTYIHVLGRQPRLGLAELEAVYGAQVRALTTNADTPMALSCPNETNHFPYLGGSVKIAQLLDVISSVSTSSAAHAPVRAIGWAQVARHIEKQLPRYLADLPAGKLKLGFSAYGLDISSGRLAATALDCKKSLRAAGRSVRIIPNQAVTLSSAQIVHNQLTGPLGCELLLIRSGDDVLIARSVYCQDIDSYAARDYGRPMRDAFVGMLPPKLAQIMINLAASPALTHATPPLRLLDPFCGTGVVLQEALLMGHAVYGTDLEQRMIDYSHANLDWLKTTFGLHSFDVTLEAGDATTHRWTQPSDSPAAARISCVAAETYLGTPLQRLPSVAALNEIVMKCNQLHQKFFTNLAAQLPSGTPLCIAVPAWRLNPDSREKARFRHLPVIDELFSLGYNQTDFTHVETAKRSLGQTSDLIYYREDQLVARELLVLTRR